MSGKFRRGGTRFKKMWRWSGEVDDFIAGRLKTLDSEAPRPILHAPSGSSGLGDVTLDLSEEATVHADMYRMPFRDRSFGTVVSDPPWNLAYDERSRLNHELARVLKDDGLLLFNAPWAPTEVLFRHDEYWLSMNRGGLDRNVSVVFVGRRRPRPPLPTVPGGKP